LDLFDLFAKISLDTSEFDSGLDSASKRFQDAGKTLSSAGSTLTKAVTLPVVGLGAAVIKTGADYEAGMSKVQAISGATGTEMDALGEKAMEMAAKTKFSTSDTAEAYQYMAMAGWDASQMVDGLSGIMNLAAASGENLGTTSDIVTDALTAFGLTAADSGRFADVLAAASNSANTNVSMLGESFKYVAPVAGAMNYSIEDVSVALGLMANSGIKASQAGTSLRTAITNMASPTSNMAAVMKEYGISLTNADGSMMSLQEVMTQLREKMGGLDEATQASAASMLFGKEAMSGMLAIINAAPEDYNKLTEAINNSAGTTEKMAAVMNDNAAGAFERLKSAVDVLFTKLSESLLPIFTKIVEKITDVVNWFAQLDEGTQNLILTIAGVAAAVGPVLVVVGNLISAISKIGSGISSLIGFIGKAGSAFSGLVKLVGSGISTVMGIGSKLMGGIKALFALVAAHPVVAIVTGIIAVITLLWTHCEEFRDAVKAIMEAVGGFFSAAFQAAQAAWNVAGAFFGGIANAIKGAFDGIGEFLSGLFTSSWKLIQAAWSVAVEFFSAIGAGIQAAFSAVTSFLGEAFSAAWKVVSAAWSGAVRFFSDIWTGIKDAAGVAADFVGGALSKAWTAITSAWVGATEFFVKIWEGIKSVFSNARDAFTEIGGNIVNGIKDGILGLWDSFTGWVGEKFNGLVSWVKDLLGIHSPSTVFAGIGSNMALGLAEGWDDEYSGIKRQIENGLNFKTASVGLTATVGGYGTAKNAQNGPQTGFGGAGNTYVTINSPVAVDAVQAAREWKKTTQRMAMGYV